MEPAINHATPDAGLVVVSEEEMEGVAAVELEVEEEDEDSCSGSVREAVEVPLKDVSSGVDECRLQEEEEEEDLLHPLLPAECMWGHANCKSESHYRYARTTRVAIGALFKEHHINFCEGFTYVRFAKPGNLGRLFIRFCRNLRNFRKNHLRLIFNFVKDYFVHGKTRESRSSLYSVLPKVPKVPIFFIHDQTRESRPSFYSVSPKIAKISYFNFVKDFFVHGWPNPGISAVL